MTQPQEPRLRAGQRIVYRQSKITCGTPNRNGATGTLTSLHTREDQACRGPLWNVLLDPTSQERLKRTTAIWHEHNLQPLVRATHSR